MVPHPQGTYANGATYWLASNRPVVQLSIRCKRCDIIIFTLFHEIGHILKRHPHTRIYIENGCSQDKLELEADNFARESLIPASRFNQFFVAGDFSRASVIAFAKSEKIHPSIVAGRIQKQTNRWADPGLNSVRHSFTWSE
jgi:HTH-type transcriptional regulator/antitoxin HigA